VAPDDPSVEGLKGLIAACGRAIERVQDPGLPYPVDDALVGHINAVRDRAVADLSERALGICARFRDANDKIARAAREIAVDPVPFLCECAAVRCTAVVVLALAEYEGLRAGADWFLNVPDHELEGGLDAVVVADHGRFVVVELIGRATTSPHPLGA
jgi:hypothetical protein